MRQAVEAQVLNPQYELGEQGEFRLDLPVLVVFVCVCVFSIH